MAPCGPEQLVSRLSATSCAGGCNMRRLFAYASRASAGVSSSNGGRPAARIMSMTSWASGSSGIGRSGYAKVRLLQPLRGEGQDRPCNILRLVQFRQVAGTGDHLDLGPAGDALGEGVGIAPWHDAVVLAPE